MRQIFRLNLLLIILISICFFQCKKTNDTETSYHLSVDKIIPNIGEAGTLVNISGKGYSLILTEDTVWFNGKPAQIKMVTDTSIQVFAPANNSSGIITVSVRGKTVDGPTFTYVQKDEPAITQITPEAGWDYTMNSVTIKGLHFGTDRNKISVLFDNIAASLQLFSDTSLIVAPPQHAAGKVPVVLIVNGKTSNTVYYTYQQKPVITKVYRDTWVSSEHPHYLLAVENLSANDTAISVMANGSAIPITAIYRAGSEPYNDPPVGDKVMLNEDEVDKNLSSNALDFIVASSGLQSDAYRFVNDPVITDITTSHTRPHSFGGGDTVSIAGKYFGTQSQNSVVEIWDSINTNTHFTPDPTILSWSNTSISLLIPSYAIRADSLTVKVKVKENGKGADVYAIYYKQQQQPPPGATVIVTVLAGDGTAGFRDGDGAQAEFNRPWNIYADAQGNIFVTDENNQRIRKITPSGVVSTFAGNGTVGYMDGSGTSAEFRFPIGLAGDAQGNIYVAGQNNRVRKITSSGVVSTLAGDGNYYTGTTTSNSIPEPYGISVDTQGNIYVGCTGDYRIRKVTPSGGISILAGNGLRGNMDGNGAIAQFDSPFGICVDGQGNVYVADQGNDRIRKITPADVVSTIAGSTRGYADDNAASAKFYGPNSMVFDAQGNMYIADTGNGLIRKLTPDGKVRTLFTTWNNNGATDRLFSPSGITIDPHGNLYVADQGNHRIVKIVIQ